MQISEFPLHREWARDRAVLPDHDCTVWGSYHHPVAVVVATRGPVLLEDDGNEKQFKYDMNLARVVAREFVSEDEV